MIALPSPSIEHSLGRIDSTSAFLWPEACLKSKDLLSSVFRIAESHECVGISMLLSP